MSGRQEKGHHDNWCNIGNQKTNNPNNQSAQKPSSKPSFILCIREAKKSNLIIIHLSLLVNHNVLFDFIPGSKNSAGFLTLWSSNLSPREKIASCTNVQLLKFVKHDWFFNNVYANPNSFQATLNSLILSIRNLPKKSKIVMTGDFNALIYDNTETIYLD